ncbi:MAG: arsenite/tail-anchored protein-transporting ATPase [Frankiales bacterium]|nr:arsenite/tail-anchored protein-transporting ATPase [Frankiales bacterium]
MRVLLFTGKGGVGKTTVAAATAAHAASQGRKTLVISTDAAHSLGDAFGIQASSEPVEVDTGLAVQQVDTQRRFEQTWRDVQSWLVSVLDAVGVDPLEAEELTVIPGADEVLALLEVRRQVESGVYDVVVVDCAPTAETLRLLALPDAFSWYIERVFPIERRVVKTLRPMLNRYTRVPMPQDKVFDAVERLGRELAAVRQVLANPASASVRLVLTPEAVVVAEARRTLTSLSLYGYRVDGVVANRVFPSDGADEWRAGWVASQAAQLAEVSQSFAPLPIWQAPYRPSEPVGIDALGDVALELYGEVGVHDPLAAPSGPELVEVERSGDEFVLSIALPLADKREVDLVRKGDELVVTVGSHRRVLALPSALRRCTVVGAALRDGRLRVRFEPDPALWMGL